MSHPGEASYNIIMSTEIIGLSHRERQIVANVVKYNTEDFFEENEDLYAGDSQDYMTVIKLVAILRVANAMDRSHKQKFRDSKAVIKDETLVITTYTKDDITLEKGLFSSKASFFEEVYGIKPVLKQKK
jgi:exopolyphosphatase/guanosine-5'-triphosphate,3'-diphosphate pyrophosphatase